jgi:glycosyltransferase involved in cell wall biosynthesis
MTDTILDATAARREVEAPAGAPVRRPVHGLVFTADNLPDFSPNRSLFVARDAMAAEGLTFDYGYASSLRSVSDSYLANLTRRRRLRWDFVLMNGLALLRRAQKFRKAIRFFHALGQPVFMLWRESGPMIEKLGREFAAEYPGFLNAFGPDVIHLAVSREVADDVVALIPGARSASVVLNCAAVPDEYRVLTSPEPRPLVINLATVQPRKGTDLFVEAALLACERNPEVVFEWYGGTTPPELLERIRAHGLEERIRFPGRTATPYEVLSRASALFFTSRNEPMAKSVLEAMAMGRSIVHFRTGGLAEAMGDTGVPVEPFDTAAAADRLLELVARPAQHRTDPAAKARYDEMFTPEAYAARLVAAVRDGIAEHRRRRRGWWWGSSGPPQPARAESSAGRSEGTGR